MRGSVALDHVAGDPALGEEHRRDEAHRSGPDHDDGRAHRSGAGPTFPLAPVMMGTLT
jgi:hypothetical protein